MKIFIVVALLLGIFILSNIDHNIVQILLELKKRRCGGMITDEQIMKYLENSKTEFHKNTFELIKRYREEIERLHYLYSCAEHCLGEIEYALEKVGQSNSRIDEAFDNYNKLIKTGWNKQNKGGD